MIDLAHSRLSPLFTRHSPCTKAARNLPRVASVCLLLMLPASSSHSHSLTATTVPILITEICLVSKMPLSHNSQTGCTLHMHGLSMSTEIIETIFLVFFWFVFIYFLFCIFLLLLSFNLFFSLFFFNSLCVSSLLQIKTSNKKSLSKRNQNQNVGLISVITWKSK